ncbi:MAG: hypothetical protein IT438_13895 [Phycisphaerales bacterium]|nr:hypothetical protein [Phycisphaerales bacterium]
MPSVRGTSQRNVTDRDSGLRRGCRTRRITLWMLTVAGGVILMPIGVSMFIACGVVWSSGGGA